MTGKKVGIRALGVCLIACAAGMYAMTGGYLGGEALFPQELPVVPQDTVPRYPVAKTVPEEYQDLVRQPAADLRSPENVKTTVEYDLRTGVYVVRTRIGEMEISTPVMLTPEEYQDYSMQQSLRSYFRQKNEEEFQREAGKAFNIADMQFDIGAAEKVFGPGGVRVKTQGSAEITLGMKSNTTKDPSLPERARSRTFFNFDENVELNMQASVGSKVNFDMNYGTKTSFDFDSKKLKLAYQGEEDEIIKNIEAGNVSMTTSNSLVNGGAALFGVKADMQFGKLRVNTLFAQQESESKTVASKGGVQTQPFEIKADKYDENRHFFLGHYFHDTYDEAMAFLPAISSKVTINRVEVWITNKRGTFDQARNIVAFSDLAEHNSIGNTQFVQPAGSLSIPYNETNNLYAQMVSKYAGARNISQVTQVLSGVAEGGRDFEKIESARRVEERDYTLNKQLGYISLRTQLQPDEVLAVAYEYQYGGTVYQVGEFSTDNADNASACLYVKLLKGTTNSPSMPCWKLMMKNVYALDAYSVQKEKFRLDVLYQSDTTGTYVNYLPEGSTQNELLLRVMNLDRLDGRNETHADGFFDFVPGFTVIPETGRIIFPVVEPFGSHLRAKIGNNALADKYTYHELYDSTLTIARQTAEKNKFILRGEYKSSSSAEIQLGATNVARGSVRVTAGGAQLTENTDYSVDYIMGTVTILNESIVASNTPVSVSLENQSMFSMQRKTMLGVDMNYQFNKDFTLGGTMMHMLEMPMTVKTTIGDESIDNLLWGLNTSYKTESQQLTNLLDKLPLLSLTRPSQIAFKAEFANLVAGHYKSKYTGGYSYLDDFEGSQINTSLQDPYAWQISSTPYDNFASPRFPEAGLTNNIDYGKNRALTAWYSIDGIFTRKNSNTIPRHITKNDQSNHYVRAIEVQELFPNKEQIISDASTLRILNVAYYPNERGPYNLDADNVNPDGTLAQPEKRWGGMMRKIEQSDFESTNIEYVEFWMLDPFIYNPTAQGGDLYINLGEISEDILRDEKKFFENGLPIDGDPAKTDTTVWGRIPRQQSTVYAFDNTAGAREKQDVGLNGLSSEEEKEFPAYKDFLNKLTMRLSPEALAKMTDDPFSPLNDPATDKFHFYRGDDYDAQELSILERYKHFNGTEGNSQAATSGRYETSSKNVPDVEDLNQDNTLNETEKYYEYKVSLRPKDLQIGINHIADIRETTPLLANGTREPVKWYLFKIPIGKHDRKVGSISDFKTIRFIRMYMTDFREPAVLRFGTLELVRGNWRTYKQDLSEGLSQGTIEVSSINIEENGDRRPVNYVLPPGITRMLDPSQSQLRQENEQALSMKISNLAPKEAKAIYQNVNYDLRQYKRMQLFTHAERFIEEPTTTLQNGEISVFLRLGSDYKGNYYEYEVPLTLTPHGEYSSRSHADQQTVWPASNLLNINLEALTDLKLNRNKAKREGRDGASFQSVYSEYDPETPRNRISVVGNPSLSEVKTIMIGVRNNSKEAKSGEIWVNELRLSDFNESGGWAANASLNVALSDLGTVNMAGRIETAGFGGLDQSLMERRLDDYSQYSLSANVQLGKLFPEKAKVNIPFYYAYSKETISPKYNPLDQDIKLSEAVDIAGSAAEKDSIRSLAQNKTITKSLSVNGMKVDIHSKNPMPYDPSNFSVGYSFSENNRFNPETEYETTKDYRGNFAYSYTPYVKPVQPFAKWQKDNGYTKYIKQFGVNYLPANIAFQTSMMRNYYEMQLRDLMSSGGGGDATNNIPVSFSQNFLWDRAFSIRWNFTSNLNASFKSGTNARIEEPYVQVNKQLNPDKYQMWKDSVMQSIRELGTPMNYDQSLQVNLTLPLQFIPVLDWTTATVNYTSSYNWDRGAATANTELEIGNVIKNQRQITLDGNFNFQSLYNKSKFLKEINQKFSPQPASTRPKANAGTATRKREPKKPTRLETEVTLNTDSGTVVEHKLLSKQVRITARRADNGRAYPIKYKSLNFDKVRITTKDSVALKLVIVPDSRPTLAGSLKTSAEYSSRLLMMVRRLSVQYTVTDGMMLPGFRPEIGSMFGQKDYGTLVPGLGFAFGDVRRSYINEAADRGWLVMNDNNTSPAMMNGTTNLMLRANLEPVPGLKIDLTANRMDTRSTTIQYMYPGMPELVGGNYSMSILSLKTAFQSTGDAANNYTSKAFDRFLENRNIIAARLEKRYAGTTYPSGGFMEGSSLAGKPYDPQQGAVSPNSADVLIPAFLAAYTGKSPKSIGLTAFPGLSSLMPNWTVTYDGLLQIPLFKRYFKSFSLNHQYRSTYAVGSFASYSNWVSAGEDGLGYIRGIQQGNPIPASTYDIASVNIVEGFAPLLAANATLLNDMTGKLQFNTSRTLNLNISSYQIVEGINNEIIVGIGYRITEFNKVLRRKASQNFSNDLNLMLDFSYRKMQSLIRKIDTSQTQATAGNIAKTVMFSADYGLSRTLTLRAFLDWQINEPLISSSAFPTSNANYGVSLRFSLTQ
ncbi:cell surface protein SprA [Bacteroidales bacterium Barb6XT]|nr:cell surface protein SprA [Bacteroidales bacterium Barb6XT]